MLIKSDHESRDSKRGRIVAAMRHSLVCMTNGDHAVCLTRSSTVEANVEAPAQKRMGETVMRLELQRIAQQRNSILSVLWHQSVDRRQRSQDQVVRVKIARPSTPYAFDFRLPQARLDRAYHAHRDLVLHLEDVVK